MPVSKVGPGAGKNSYANRYQGSSGLFFVAVRAFPSLGEFAAFELVSASEFSVTY